MRRMTSPAILVVDDDLGFRETFNWALRAYGYQVTTAASGAKAILLARSSHFDLMLVDLRLPDMSGMNVIRSLRSEGSEVPFALVSAFMTDDSALEAKELGAIGVWEKPLSVEVVVGHVREALSRNH